MVNWRGILCLAGGFCFHLVIGCLYLFGGIANYCASYLRVQGDQDASTSLIMLFVPLRGVIMIFLLPYGTYLEAKYGARLGIGVSIVVFISCMIATSFSKTAWEFILFMSIGFGVSTGLGYVSPIAAGWKHFPNSRGIVSGVILCGFGLGSFIFTFLAKGIANPNNEKYYSIMRPGEKTAEHFFHKDVANNVPKMYWIMTAIWSVLLVISFIFVTDPPGYSRKEKKDEEEVRRTYSVDTVTFKDIGADVKLAQEIDMIRYSIDSTEAPDSGLEKGLYDGSRNSSIYALATNDCPNIKTGLKSSQFWILTTMLTFAVFIDFFLSMTYKSIGFKYHYTDTYCTIIGSVYSVINGTVRIFWGILLQKYKFRVLYTIILIGQATLTGTLVYVGTVEALFGLWILTDVFFIGGNYSLFPPVCAQVFGLKLGAQMYGFVASGFTFASILMFFANKYLLPYTGYTIFLWLTAGVNYFSLILLWIFYKHTPNWNKDVVRSKSEISLDNMNINPNKSSILLDD